MDARTRQFGLAGFMRQAFLWALLPILVLFLIAPSVGGAQVTTNITPSALPPCPGTCGSGVTIVAPPSTGDTVTTITGGARPGNGPNLFHSFGRFDVGTGDVANFFNETSLPTSNILSRVTGGNPSQIYGTIQTTDFPGANLFLMNPAGVLFGPTAVLDLGAITGSAVRQPGSFYATTADYLNLVDDNGTGSPFYADPAQMSVLSVAPVAAFGFTALNPVSISIEGSTLMVGQGQTLSIVGGNTPFNKTIQEEPLLEQPVPSGVTVTGGTLLAPGGQINLVSVASPGEVLVPSFQTGQNIEGASVTSFGSVSLAPGSSIDVSGTRTVFIKGGQLVLSVNDATLSTSESPAPSDTISLGLGSSIVTSNSGTDPGANVQMTAGTVQMDGAMIQTINSGDLDGGNISINATTVSLTNGTLIESSTAGPGRGGDVQVNAGTLTMENFTTITTVTAGGGGVGGDVVLNVGRASLISAAILSQNQNLTLEGGQGGSLIIRGLQGVGSAAESVILSGGSGLFTQNLGNSDGGQVAITSKSLKMDGPGTTINALASNVGRGGDIVLSVEQASLTGGAFIETLAGSADPQAQPGPTLTVQGLQGAGSRAESVVLSGFRSGIISDSQGPARAGDIAVYAKTVSVADGAIIQAGTTITPAAGGNVTIEADSVDISGGSRLSSQAGNSNAGEVTISANTLLIDKGSIQTSSNSAGSGGDVVLNVGIGSLSNGATINSSSTSTGNAGSVTIISASNFIMRSSSITTTSEISSGGQVTITAPDMVQLINSKISTSVAGSDADTTGGNITIDPQFVVLQNGQILANANAGAGGAINIIATSAYIEDPASIVSASSTLGISGPVNIQSPLQNVGAELTALSQEFSSAAALLAQQCAARVADGKFSTFVVAAREGLPMEPGGFLASPSWTAELLGSRLSDRGSETQLSAVSGLFPKYDARPIQLAKFGGTCR